MQVSYCYCMRNSLMHMFQLLHLQTGGAMELFMIRTGFYDK